jgi:hypothetical protein
MSWPAVFANVVRQRAAMSGIGVRRGKGALSSGCRSQEQPARLQIELWSKFRNLAEFSWRSFA